MNDPIADIATELREALGLHREALALVERENQDLRSPDQPSLFETFSLRRQLLPKLDRSVQRLRHLRVVWSRFTPAERACHAQVGALLRQCQDTILKVLMLDRENEQALLRRGLLGPRHLPAHQSQRPHFVANLYRQHGPGAPDASTPTV